MPAHRCQICSCPADRSGPCRRDKRKSGGRTILATSSTEQIHGFYCRCQDRESREGRCRLEALEWQFSPTMPWHGLSRCRLRRAARAIASGTRAVAWPHTVMFGQNYATGRICEARWSAARLNASGVRWMVLHACRRPGSATPYYLAPATLRL